MLVLTDFVNHIYHFSEHWLQGRAEVLHEIPRKNFSKYSVKGEKSLQSKNH